MISTLYQELRDKLMTNPLIEHVDLFNQQQFEAYIAKQEVAFPTPAVLIDIQAIQWETMSTGSQKGDTIIDFYILQEQYSSSHTNKYGGSENVSNALEKIDNFENIHVYLQTFSGSVFENLDRVESLLDNDHDALRSDKLSYKTTVYDISTCYDRDRTEVMPWQADISESVHKNGLPNTPSASSSFVVNI